jgi:hypothetical protein
MKKDAEGDKKAGSKSDRVVCRESTHPEMRAKVFHAKEACAWTNTAFELSTRLSDCPHAAALFYLVNLIFRLPC